MISKLLLPLKITCRELQMHEQPCWIGVTQRLCWQALNVLQNVISRHPSLSRTH